MSLCVYVCVRVEVCVQVVALEACRADARLELHAVFRQIVVAFGVRNVKLVLAPLVCLDYLIERQRLTDGTTRAHAGKAQICCCPKTK